MSDLSIRAAGMAAPQPNWVQEQDAAENDVLAEGSENGDIDVIQSMLKEQEEQSKSLAEMIDAAQKKAAEQREALKLPKSNTRYGDAPLEAYARLARAKTTAQVNAASGFARRKLFQLKAALGSDSENAPTIRGAINQLQKSINRAERKKRELVREKLLDAQRAKARRAKEEQKAAPGAPAEEEPAGRPGIRLYAGGRRQRQDPYPADPNPNRAAHPDAAALRLHRDVPGCRRAAVHGRRGCACRGRGRGGGRRGGNAVIYTA